MHVPAYVFELQPPHHLVHPPALNLVRPSNPDSTALFHGTALIGLLNSDLEKKEGLERQVRREHGDGGKGVRSDDSPGIISCPVQLRPPTLQSSLRVRCRHLLRHGPNPLRCAGRHCASPQARTPSSPSSGTAHAVRRGAPAVASSVWISMPSPPLHPTIAAASVGRRPEGPPRQLKEIGSSRRRRGERRA
jgi:hypothetical protein